jgi:hypothetical protein
MRSQPTEDFYQALNGKKSGLPSAQRPLTSLPNKSLPPTLIDKSTAPAASAMSLLPTDPQISILRHTDDTDTMKREVVSTVLQIAPDLRSTLADWGLKLVLTPTILEALPELVGERPRGYLHGGGYTNCGGSFRPASKTIYVAERVAPGTFPPQLNLHMGRTFFHEFGHAVDHCKKISRSDAFAAAYQSDCNHLTNGIRDHFYYYTQSGEAGPIELFAQLFACAVAAPGTLDTDDQNLTKVFPNCFTLVKKVVATTS